MSQHCLYSSKVCTAFKQMSGKAMSQCVWTQRFLNPSFQSIISQVVKHRDAREMLAAMMAQKDVVLLARLRVYSVSVIKPLLQNVYRIFRYWNEPLLRAFA